MLDAMSSEEPKAENTEPAAPDVPRERTKMPVVTWWKIVLVLLLLLGAAIAAVALLLFIGVLLAWASRHAAQWSHLPETQVLMAFTAVLVLTVSALFVWWIASSLRTTNERLLAVAEQLSALAPEVHNWVRVKDTELFEKSLERGTRRRRR